MHETLRFILERKTGLYTTYLVSFILFNWKFFYTLLFDDSPSEDTHIGKALYEFINRFPVLGFEWGHFWIFQFILPLVMTWLAITQLPKLNNWAYEFHLKYQGDRVVMRSKQDRDSAKKIAKYKEDEVESLNTIAVATERKAEIEESLPRESIWENEYTESSKLKDVLRQVAYTVYENSGKIFSGGARNVSADVLAIADAYGLIDFNESRTIIYFTEKGQYMQKLVIKYS